MANRALVVMAQIIQLFNIINWMLQLPKGLESEFLQVVYAIEEEKHMPYINTAERLGIEKGLEQGRRKGWKRAWNKAAWKPSAQRHVI